MIYRLREVFNKDFDDVFTKKEQELVKIKEKNKRINKILVDIEQMNQSQADPELIPLEKPEKLFVVEDSEVCHVFHDYILKLPLKYTQ